MFANEKRLERRLRKKVKELGGWAVKFFPVNLAGFPDRMVLMYPAKVWFVEMKSTKKNPSPVQAAVHSMLNKLGFSVLVIDTDELLNEFLKVLKVWKENN